MPPPRCPPEIRAKLALVLDIDDLVPALRLARELRPFFGVAKVGLELYAAAGPDAITSLMEQGYDVFVDLKLLDIPTTVGKAARVLGVARGPLPHAARPRRRRPCCAAGVRGAARGRRAGRAWPSPSPWP